MTERKKNFFLDEICLIKEVGFIQTFDFTIPETHCFFANDILVHNTGFLEDHADIVLLLDWAYKTGHSKDENLYYINVAKNRNGPTGFIELKFWPQYFLFEDNESVKEEKKIEEIKWEE